MEIEELITGYYNQTLSEAEEAVFQQKFDNDASFRKLSEQMEIEILAARKAGRKQLKAQFDQWEAAAPDGQSVREKRSFAKVLKIAIAAAIVLAVGIYLMAPNADKDLFAGYYTPYENYEYTQTRDESGSVENLKAKAYQAYDEGDFKAAKNYFVEFLAANPNDVPALFFKGICQIETKQWQLALVDLSAVADSKDPFYADAAKWYLALAHLQLEDLPASKKLLNELSSIPGDYQQKAQDLLKAL
ncbi:MAG: hypothetical protein AAFO69_08725 [Bacteroidota bacterium]